MKKTLATLAVLGAFAGTAMAADVTLYGIVDTGLVYSHVDADVAGVADVDQFEMKSGNQSGSRWGLKGVEDLGNGMKVGFVLENGFESDTGVDKGSMFDRESALFLEGGFGKVAAGRMGSINNGTSSWGLIGMTSAFGTSWGEFAAQAGRTFATAGVKDNMLSYQTPSFGGVKVYAQYAMGNNGAENESKSDRYYAVGATYNAGPAALYLAVDSTNYQTWKTDGTGPVANANNIDDSLTVTFGGNFDFEVAKLFAGAQYFDEVKLSAFGGVINAIDDAAGDIMVKGYGLNLGVTAPVLGGEAAFGVGYVDAELADSFADALPGVSADLDRYVVSAGYTYNFSKRTNLYTVATYMQDQWEVSQASAKASADPSAYAFMVGLRHKF